MDKYILIVFSGGDDFIFHYDGKDKINPIKLYREKYKDYVGYNNFTSLEHLEEHAINSWRCASFFKFKTLEHLLAFKELAL